MAPRKPKQTPAPGPLEKQLKATEEAQKAAQRKASNAAKPLTIAPPPEIFFYKNPKHPYGTCWQCGDRRQHAGGLPGGHDAYFCPKCKAWLPIRDSPKDPAKVRISTDKNEKKSRE